MDRFSKLVKQTLSRNKKGFITMLLVVMATPLLLVVFSMILKSDYYTGRAVYMQARFYRSIFSTTAILAPYLFFFNINRPKKGIAEPMLHASALERFLNMALFCFVLVPLSTVMVYGVSHHMFVVIFPQHLYKFSLIDLQHVFVGRLFTPTLILLMQTTFFFNLLFRERKVRKLFLTLGVIVFIELLFPYISFQINWYVPAFILLLLRVFGSLYVPLISILSAFLFISSCFLLKRKSIPLTTNLPAARCDKCGAKLKEI